MTPKQLLKLRKWAKAKDGSKLTQEKVKVLLGLDSQSTISKAENGNLTLATATINRYIEALTPSVMFIGGDKCDAELIASAHIVGKEQKAIIDDASNFYKLLQMGLNIVVLTNDKEPYLTLIEQALVESELPVIPIRGIKIINRVVEQWDD